MCRVLWCLFFKNPPEGIKVPLLFSFPVLDAQFSWLQPPSAFPLGRYSRCKVYASPCAVVVRGHLQQILQRLPRWKRTNVAMGVAQWRRTEVRPTWPATPRAAIAVSCQQRNFKLVYQCDICLCPARVVGAFPTSLFFSKFPDLGSMARNARRSEVTRTNLPPFPKSSFFLPPIFGKVLMFQPIPERRMHQNFLAVVRSWTRQDAKRSSFHNFSEFATGVHLASANLQLVIRFVSRKIIALIGGKGR